MAKFIVIAVVVIIMMWRFSYWLILCIVLLFWVDSLAVLCIRS